MNGGVDLALVPGIADVLHDVNLAAVGPSGTRIIRAEHPECGPDALAFGDLHARLDATVGPRLLAQRLDASRGVVVGAVSFFLGGDDEIAVAVHGRVVGRVGVVFELAVAKAIAARVKHPFGGIDGRTRGAVELIAPNEMVSRVAARAGWSRCAAATRGATGCRRTAGCRSAASSFGSAGC